MLVEMHMLKDYKTRVTGNYEILRSLMAVVNRDAAKLIQLNADADAKQTLGAHLWQTNRFHSPWDGAARRLRFSFTDINTRGS